MFTIRYVDKWTITSWNKEPFKLFVYSDVFNDNYILNHDGVMKWGSWFALEDNMVEVTPELLQQYPLLLALLESTREENDDHCRSVSCILFLMEDLVMIVRINS